MAVAATARSPAQVSVEPAKPTEPLVAVASALYVASSSTPASASANVAPVYGVCPELVTATV